MIRILLLSFLAVSSSTPLGWGPTTGSWYGTDIASSPAERASLQIGLQLQEAIGANVIGNQVSGISTGIGSQVKQVAAAHHVAQEVVEQALRARQEQTSEGIEDYKQQLQQKFGVFGAGHQSVVQQVEKISTIDAINQLQQHLQIQQSIAPLIQASSPLVQTLEAVIQTKMVSDNVNAQQLGWFGQISQIPEQSLHVFQAKIQQLIDQHNIQEIQSEISRQQAIVQQLQQQQQLINLKKNQIQAQAVIVLKSSKNNDPVVQLQQTQNALQLQEQQLVKQQLARQLIIQHLQHALVEQQKQLQQDIVSEQDAQAWAEKQYSRSYGSTWNSLRGSWNQSGRSWYKPNAEKNWHQDVWSIKGDLIQ